MITNHDEGDVDDPVTVSQALNSDLSAAGIGRVPLSANEYQPADRQTAGVTAWYLARFAQSGYTNAMRGNWVCCVTPNLTGVLTQVNGTWQPTGNWWAMRDYADMTGTLVNTSGPGRHHGDLGVRGQHAPSARWPSSATPTDTPAPRRSPSTACPRVPWLANGGSVNVTVDRIPDQAPLTAPQVVYSQNVSTSGGSVTVPFTFQASHDAFAIYVTPGGRSTAAASRPAITSSWSATTACALDVYGNTSTAGAAIDQWTCNGQTNQQFQFVPVSGGYGELQAQNSGQDVTVASSSTAAGHPGHRPAAGERRRRQPVAAEQQSDGSWQFKNQNSGLCLDVYGASAHPASSSTNGPARTRPAPTRTSLPGDVAGTAGRRRGLSPSRRPATCAILLRGAWNEEVAGRWMARPR